MRERSRWLGWDQRAAWALLALIAVGAFFRFFNIDHKLYDFDEVYTSSQAAGYTNQEMKEYLFRDRFLAAGELRRLQTLKPGSSAWDTIHVLALDDPQFPPLYFLVARGWMWWFGPTVTAMRLLPAVLSLGSLPLMWGLAWELFGSTRVVILATTLLALCPLDVLYAQTSRNYSALTLTTIAAGLCLLRALRRSTWAAWGLYGLVCVIGLYNHILFALVLLGHAVFVLVRGVAARRRAGSVIGPFAVVAGGATILFAPWVAVMIRNHAQALESVRWVYAPGRALDPLYITKHWALIFSGLFFDADYRSPFLGLGVDMVWTYAVRLPFLVVIGAAMWMVWRHAGPEPRWFTLTTTVVPFLTLAGPDVVWGGERSAIARFLVPSFPGVLLAVAYFVARATSSARADARRLGWISGAVVLSGTLVSCVVSASADTWWNRDQSYANARAAKAIRGAGSPLVVGDRDEYGISAGDLISLGSLLDADGRLLLLDSPPPSARALAWIGEESKVFLFRNSWKLRTAVEQLRDTRGRAFECRYVTPTLTECRR